MIRNYKEKGIFFLLILVVMIPTIVSASSFSNEMLYSVSIVGSVHLPGVYQIPPFTRVSELYKMANTPLQKNIEPEERKEEIEKLTKPSLRNVVIIRGGTSLPIDLAKFYHTGDIAQNPYLEDGDIVHVAALINTIFITGEINKSGMFEILPSTTLDEIIDFSWGFTQDADKNEIFIYRYSGKEPEILKYSFEKDKTNILKNQDRIVIHRKINLRNKNDFVFIQGQVKFPGEYPFQEEKTTLLEIIELAGGILESADLSYAYIKRLSENDTFENEKMRLTEKPYSEMTHVEKEYLKSFWRYASDNIVIDVESLLKTRDDKYNLLLKKNDFIFIPDKNKTITITGNVTIPGKYTYIPNTTFNAYIEKAGGYSWRFDKKNIRVVRFQTGEWLKPNDETILFPGDMIVVPEKKVYDRWVLSKDVLQVVVQFVTLIVLINNLSAK